MGTIVDKLSYLSVFNIKNCIVKTYTNKSPVYIQDKNGGCIGFVCGVYYNGGEN